MPRSLRNGSYQTVHCTGNAIINAGQIVSAWSQGSFWRKMGVSSFPLLRFFRYDYCFAKASHFKKWIAGVYSDACFIVTGDKLSENMLAMWGYVAQSVPHTIHTVSSKEKIEYVTYLMR
jgi:hypothetical protein